MKGFENEIYRYLLLTAILVSITLLVTAVKWPRIARLLFFCLFAWASWMNWKTSQQTPQVYLDYGDLTWSNLYRNFIYGWFSRHIRPTVGFIATCQGMIAISMLLKDRVLRVGATGAIIFLLAIVPFGIGSGFPATVIMAVAMMVLMGKRTDQFLWQSNMPVTN